MKDVIEQLFKFDRYLLGAGYDNSLEFISHLIGLETIEIPSGTKVGTWTVPDEWVVRDAWVKFNGEKIIDFKTNPLSLVVGSTPVHGIVKLDELKKHLHFSDEKPDATPYVFKYYDKDWGFCVPKTQAKKKVEEGCENGVCVPDLKDVDPTVGKVQIEGIDYTPKWQDNLQEGDYEVFIDTEYKPGVMKLGVHTIPGKLDKEILLFAHLDHPYQANDNLSAVACLVDLATKLDTDYTIKIIFCPETIGSVAYAETQDISKVEFVIAVDICGNNNSILLQKSWNPEDRLNRVAHLAIQGMGQTYRKGQFRNVIGSDEYYFNDPLVGIPGLMLSTWPYAEYHTSEDTPEKIDYTAIEKMGKAVMNIIKVWERDFIPQRNFKGPLMRSRYGIQTPNKQLNLSWDYFFYSIDGKRTLAELCSDYGLNFDYTFDVMEKMIADGVITKIDVNKDSRPNPRKKGVKKATGKK